MTKLKIPASTKITTTRRGNIIRVRVHQPGKQKDMYVHKAHLLNMINLPSI